MDIESRTHTDNMGKDAQGSQEKGEGEFSNGCWKSGSVSCAALSRRVHEFLPRDEAQRGGWKTMPFILGNEVCDKLATIGLFFSMILYLTEDYHLEQVTAANILSVVSGTNSLAPLVGGYLADTYLGRFLTVLIASFFSLVGMIFLILTAAIPSLKPAPCSTADWHCTHPSPMQLLFLYSAFIFIVISSGGIRPCSYPFGADQFSQDTLEGRKAFQSFSNWYFFGIYLSVLLAGTIVVYVQQDVGWAMGFAIPAITMVISIVVYLLGMPLYRYVTPAGSPLKQLAKVVTAALFKRKLPLPSDSDNLYDVHGEDSKKLQVEDKFEHTDQFRFFDKAAIVLDGDLEKDGKISRPWRICTVHQVEQLKVIIRTVPIMISAMIHSSAVSQQTSFSTLQANTMDRHMIGSFQIPAASVGVFPMLAIMICLPVYDKVVLPFARRVTGNDRGITFLQRIGAGYFLGGCAMVLSGIVEAKRRSVARENGLADKPHDVVPMSVFWLVPQMCLMGLGEAFNGIGLAEFFYDQVPETMRSTAGSFNSLGNGVGVYISAIVLTTVDKVTKRNGRVGWLNDNLNRGRLENYYYLVAGMLALNLCYFLICSRWYTYKNSKPSRVEVAELVEAQQANCTHPGVQVVELVEAHETSSFSQTTDVRRNALDSQEKLTMPLPLSTSCL